MDHFLAGVYIRRKVQFMAKSQLFGNPILNWIFRNGGVFPVRRGYDDTEAFKTAETVLANDRALLMYAEGGRSRSGDLGKPKRGVGKIALETGAPVVPVAIHGSLGVRGWKRLHFPKVTVQYGEPCRSRSRRTRAARPSSRSPTRSSTTSVRCTWTSRRTGVKASFAASGRGCPRPHRLLSVTPRSARPASARTPGRARDINAYG